MLILHSVSLFLFFLIFFIFTAELFFSQFTSFSAADMSNGEPCTPRQHPGDISEKEADAGILPSHGITLSLPIQDTQRPGIVQHLYVCSAYLVF